MSSQSESTSRDSKGQETLDPPPALPAESTWEIDFAAALENGLIRVAQSTSSDFDLTPTPSTRKGKKQRKIHGAIIGKLLGYSETGTPLVVFAESGSEQGVPARTTVACQGAVGKEVVLMCERGNPGKPIIMGLLQPSQAETTTPSPMQATVDGERLVFTAEKEIVLRCGNASLTLTQAGKVLLKGAYVSSHSSGMVRIKGGSVQIN